jgi:hypothetical protein
MAASITVNLDDEFESILNDLTNETNRLARLQNLPEVTPAQFLRQFVRDYLRSQATRLEDSRQLGLRAAFKLATPEEQANISAILDKYR